MEGKKEEGDLTQDEMDKLVDPDADLFDDDDDDDDDDDLDDDEDPEGPDGDVHD